MTPTDVTMWTNLDMCNADCQKSQICDKNEPTRCEFNTTMEDNRLERVRGGEFDRFVAKFGRDTHFKSSDTKREPRGLFLDKVTGSGCAGSMELPKWRQI